MIIQIENPIYEITKLLNGEEDEWYRTTKTIIYTS
jgi:hypothetical protein